MPTYSTFWIEKDRIPRLRVLWNETLPDGRPRYSTSAIGRELGCSKNAVIGKAQREGLPARACPIIRAPDDPRRGKGNSSKPVPRAGAKTLPTLSSLTKPVEAAPTVKRVQPAAAPKPPPQAPLSPPEAPPRAPMTPAPYGKVMECCWPLGHPGTSSFCFCKKPSVPGKPYCQSHVEVAYVRIRDRREDEAA